MKKSKYSVEQVTFALKPAQLREEAKALEVCYQVSEQMSGIASTV